MKDEIKEILEDVKRHLDYVEATKQASVRDNEMKAMYDYTTNLQTIEQQYSAILSENAELENRIKELEQINEEHRKINGELRKTINEAIDYIKHVQNYGKEKSIYVNGDDLLNILQGSDE